MNIYDSCVNTNITNNVKIVNTTKHGRWWKCRVNLPSGCLGISRVQMSVGTMLWIVSRQQKRTRQCWRQIRNCCYKHRARGNDDSDTVTGASPLQMSKLMHGSALLCSKTAPPSLKLLNTSGGKHSTCVICFLFNAKQSYNNYYFWLFG